jgi:hypothetical protein
MIQLSLHRREKAIELIKVPLERNQEAQKELKMLYLFLSLMEKEAIVVKRAKMH